MSSGESNRPSPSVSSSACRPRTPFLTMRTLAEGTGEPEWSSTILPFMAAADAKYANRQKITDARQQLAGNPMWLILHPSINLCDMRSEISALAGLRLIDLSVAIEHNAPGEMTPPKIQYLDHAAGGQTIANLFGCRPEDLIYSKGAGWAVENLIANSHTGTHIDAPYHYGVTSAGLSAKRVYEVPLERCFRPRGGIALWDKKSGALFFI